MKKITLEQFKSDCSKIIQHYAGDLDIDLRTIQAGKPGLFFAYLNGSHCIELPQFERLPAHGVSVSYLFGKATREHIVRQVGTTLNCESVKSALLVHYFDGRALYRINHEQAKQIAEDYRRKMFALFDQQLRGKVG